MPIGPLLKLLTELHNPGGQDGSSWELSRPIPEALRTDEKQYLTLSGDVVIAFRIVEAALRKDPLCEHLADGDIEEALWGLVFEVVLAGAGREPKSRRAVAQAFLKEARRDWDDYDFYEEVRGLHPDAAGSRLGDVQIERVSAQLLRDLNLWDAPYRPHSRGRLVMHATVKAGAYRRALARGTSATARARAELRFGLQSTLRIRLFDDQVAFPTGWRALRLQSENRTRWSPGLFPADHIEVWPGDLIVRAIAFLKPLYELRLSLAPSFSRRLDTALAWLDKSRRSPEPELAFLALISAIEALLGERSERRKGALLALRAMLVTLSVDGHFSDPAQLARLYEIRSDLTHGSSSELAPDHVWSIRTVAEDAFWTTVRFLHLRRDIITSRAFDKALDEPELLSKAGAWLRQIDTAPYQDMAEVAVKRGGLNT